MLFRLILLVAVIFAIFWSYRKLNLLPAEQKKKAYLTLGLWVCVLVLVLGVVTGRLHWLGIIFAFVIGAAKLGLRFFPILKFIGSRAGVKNPIFNTPNLACAVDMKSQKIQGEVLTGELKGRRLESLTLEEILALREQYKDSDKRAFYLLLVLLKQRSYHSGQQHSDNTNDYSDINAPDICEAIQILGISKDYTKQDIIDAHRRLIQKLHPDRGGNDYLASRVNEAKEVLLAQIKN